MGDIPNGIPREAPEIYIAPIRSENEAVGKPSLAEGRQYQDKVRMH